MESSQASPNSTTPMSSDNSLKAPEESDEEKVSFLATSATFRPKLFCTINYSKYELTRYIDFLSYRTFQFVFSQKFIST